MITIGMIYRYLDTIAPFRRAMSWDNSGLLVGSQEDPAGKVLLALDATLPVVEEAAKMGAGLIVSHHPVIFHPLKAVGRNHPVYQAIRHGIGIISAHTNLDVAEGGVNDALAELLCLQERKPFALESQENYQKMVVFVPKEAAQAVTQAMGDAGAGQLGAYSHCSFSSAGTGAFLPLEGANPYLGQVGKLEEAEEIRVEMIVPPGKTSAVVKAMKQAHPYEVPAYDLLETQAVQEKVSLGRTGLLPAPLAPQEFARFVRERLGGGVRMVEGNRPVQKVAVCGGSGGDLVSLAVSMGMDALVTGDVKHDQLLSAQAAGLTLIDGGHYATEAPVLPVLRQKLQENFPQGEFFISQTETHPFLSF